MRRTSFLISLMLMIISLNGLTIYGGHADAIISFNSKENLKVQLGQTPPIHFLNDSICTITGNEIDEYFGGFHSHGAGDVNGDGYDDLLVSAGATKPYGAVYLLFGRGAGFPDGVPVANADVVFLGDVPNNQLARSAGAGDVNGDGYDDILMSMNNYGSDGIERRGKTVLFFGRATDKWKQVYSGNESDASFIGAQSYEYSGHNCAGVGDLNGDGTDDFFISAPWGDANGLINCGIVYLLFGRTDNWSNDMVLNSANISASFYGEGIHDHLGVQNKVTRIGDVNGDGYDDLLLNSERYDNNTFKGETYLVYGKKEGWGTEMDVGIACDCSFIGTSDGEYSGFLGGWGDVNNDGYDDILIGSPAHNDDIGTSYLFFGGNSQWGLRTPLSEADVILSGDPGQTSQAGFCVAILGDVDGDGYDDMAIAAVSYVDNTYGKIGAIHIVLGSEKDAFLHTMDLSLDSDLIYLGEPPSGLGERNTLVRVGDVNNDGYDDMLCGNRNYKSNQGKAYLTFISTSKEQLSTYSVDLFGDVSYSTKITKAMIGEAIFVELKGQDGNASHKDQAFVMIKRPGMAGMPLMLEETGDNTGLYIGNFTLDEIYSTFKRTYPVKVWNEITVYAVKDPSSYSSILVDTWIGLYPNDPITINYEGEQFVQKYQNRGRNETKDWFVEIDPSIDWLTWNGLTKTLYGTPDNTNIRSFYITINITDYQGNFDFNRLFFNVINKDPKIATIDKPDAYEDCKYYVDYDSDEDGQGDITWSISPELTFLTMDPETGILTGTPANGYDGQYLLNVTVKDGNGGMNWSEFVLTVHDVNNPPVILTEDVTEVYEDSHYLVEYSGTDRDWDDVLTWSLDTNCEWLTLDQQSLSLMGTPRNEDVGPHYVNISVTDGRGGLDYHNFTLNVINTNDPLHWAYVSDDIDMEEGEYINLEFEAIDEDIGDIIQYSISSFPDVGLGIDPDNGTFIWKATPSGLFLDDDGTYTMEVTVTATDGMVKIYHHFLISVVPNPAPTSDLNLPDDGDIVTLSDLRLTWNGEDPDDDDLIYTVYIDEDPLKVLRLRSDCMNIEETDEEFLVPEDLERGKTYYWTVIPSDGVSDGICLDNVFEFHVNSPPVITAEGDRDVIEGKYFQVTVNGFDPDSFISQNVKYSVKSGPDGLTISETTGTITWMPDHEDIGEHEVTVLCSDGMEETEMTFTITVKELEDTGGGKDAEDDQDNGIMIFLLVLIVVAVILFGIMIIYMHSGKTEEKEFQEEDEDLPFLGEEEHEEPLLAKQEEELDGP